MLNYIKRIVPTPLKRALRQSLKDLTGESVLLQRTRDSESALLRIRKLERRTRKLEKLVDELQDSVFELKPEIVHRSDDTERRVTELLVQHGMPSTVNINISKNDLMYQYMARFTESTEQAYVDYISSGLQMMQILETIVSDELGDIRNISAFLDFASGYGRLTRFLVQTLDADRVWVSDIKASAVEFQQQQFGVYGFVSSETPEDLTINKHFDCIFVGSLFTHLPEATFGRWLQRLCDLLSPNGMIIFTVHDASLLDGKSYQEQGSDITFRPSSEETILRGTDQPLNPDLYGTTYVSEAFVQKVIEGLPFENKRYARYKKAKWGKQDIYILSRNSGDVLDDLQGYVNSESP